MAVTFQNDPVDVSEEFRAQNNHFFLADRCTRFDPTTRRGELVWRGTGLRQRVSYHQLTLQFGDSPIWADMPPHEYADDQSFGFEISFPSPRAARVRLAARPLPAPADEDSPMLARPPAEDRSWSVESGERRWAWHGQHGSLVLEAEPFRLELRDADGELLTATNHHSASPSVVDTNPMPLSFVRSSASLHRHLAASLSLAPGERLYGCGESFTRLDKRGQKLLLWTRDAYSAATPYMYKPVPFFLSSRGWAAFAHTSAPATFDLGHDWDGAAVLYLADDVLDLFLFLGAPAEVLGDYTALTGRAPEPPVWTLGLWMGRDSYRSRDELERVAARLREERVPCDVLHVDTEWTEVPFRQEFRFSPSRFPEPEEMLARLRERGFRLSLWQFPYLHPTDELHTEAIRRRLVVFSESGEPPVDDAVLDLGHPEAAEWYQELLARLLEQGVAVFTSDFGEAAPFGGVYHDNRTGFYEHNLYPLRYGAAVAAVTERVAGHGFQWLRAAWAGSQRHPVHFGGDAETANTGLAASLRGGLSLGLCGFSFWGTFTGGFPKPPDPQLYLRWLAFSTFCSHLRCHGSPPREPWELGPEFTDRFRAIVELRYRLIPYVYAQACAATSEGHPLIRPLFFDHPGDPGSWQVEDAYKFGRDLLVAPLLEQVAERDVWLPPGRWADPWSGERHEGPGWRRLRAGELPVVVLAREGAAIPLAGLAQCTDELDWERLELAAFGDEEAVARGLVRVPGEPAREAVVRGGELVDGEPGWSLRASL